MPEYDDMAKRHIEAIGRRVSTLEEDIKDIKEAVSVLQKDSRENSDRIEQLTRAVLGDNSMQVESLRQLVYTLRADVKKLSSELLMQRWLFIIMLFLIVLWGLFHLLGVI